MILFICPTCETKYESEMTERGIYYMAGNKRVDLKSENQDCETCKVEIDEEVKKAKADARARVKERKNHG